MDSQRKKDKIKLTCGLEHMTAVPRAIGIYLFYELPESKQGILQLSQTLFHRSLN